MKRINKNYSLDFVEVEALKLLRQQLFDQVIGNEPYHPYASEFDGKDAVHYALWLALHWCSYNAESNQVRHECDELLNVFGRYERRGRR